MKSFGTYIARHLAAFAAFMLALLLINAALFGATFFNTVSRDYGSTSPRAMLSMAASSATADGLSPDAAHTLRSNGIWAVYIAPDGQCLWTLDAPECLPKSYTIQDVAAFAKGYLADYPVFIWNTDDGLLVLGYPKDSYTKLTSNYYSLEIVKKLPLYAIGMIAADGLCMFLAYLISKRHIMKNIDPLVKSIEMLASGKPVSLKIGGELADIAASVNRVSLILSRQNAARANWISGVTHDIRTPLSIIMGYAGRIASNASASAEIREQADIVRRQSAGINDLVQDLNLVSQLEYDMQPISKQPERLSKIVRSCAAELINSGTADKHEIGIDISPEAESATIDCDARLISRAIMNLVQNSIKHNPDGCSITIALKSDACTLAIEVADNGKGISAEKLREFEQRPHYMESTDERLDLRHGLGLLIVRQIVKAHMGSMDITSCEGAGCTITLKFYCQST